MKFEGMMADDMLPSSVTGPLGLWMLVRTGPFMAGSEYEGHGGGCRGHEDRGWLLAPGIGA